MVNILHEKQAVSFHDIHKVIKSSEEGKTLFTRTILPIGNTSVKKHLVICHSLFGHQGRYTELMEKLKYSIGSDTMITLYDLVGHGQSSGARSYIEEFKNFSEDLISVLNHTKHYYKDDIQTFIIAPCISGNITVHTLIDYELKLPCKISGVVFLNPLFRPKFSIPRWSHQYFKKIKPEFLKLKTPYKIDTNNLLNCSKRRSLLTQDYLVNHSPTLGLQLELSINANYIRSLSFYFDTPSLFLLSKYNSISDREANISFSSSTNAPSEIELLNNSGHNILSDKDWEQATERIITWLKNF